MASPLKKLLTSNFREHTLNWKKCRIFSQSFHFNNSLDIYLIKLNESVFDYGKYNISFFSKTYIDFEKLYPTMNFKEYFQKIFQYENSSSKNIS